MAAGRRPDRVAFRIVRSLDDHAATGVVWDVDPLAETITCCRPGVDDPVAFRTGGVADAEPAVPGWRINVDEVFS